MISHVVIMYSIFLVLGLAVGFVIGCIFTMVVLFLDRSREVKKQNAIEVAWEATVEFEEGMGWVGREGEQVNDANSS